MAPRGVGANQNLKMNYQILQNNCFWIKTLENGYIKGFWEAFMAPRGVGANQNTIFFKYS